MPLQQAMPLLLVAINLYSLTGKVQLPQKAERDWEDHSIVGVHKRMVLHYLESGERA